MISLKTAVESSTQRDSRGSSRHGRESQPPDRRGPPSFCEINGRLRPVLPVCFSRISPYFLHGALWRLENTSEHTMWRDSPEHSAVLHELPWQTPRCAGCCNTR